MIGSIFFIYNRLVEIVFLIPIIGMLAYFIDAYQKTNQITPVYVLVLFIVSVIAIFWCLDTLIRLKTTKRSAIFVVFVDLLFFGAFIASVYELRFIATADCKNWDGGSDAVYKSLGPFGLHGEQTGNPLANKLNKSCAMLKASFAMGIMETIFFMWTAILAFFLHLGHRGEGEGDATGPGIGVAYRGRHGHGHRRRSHSSRRGNRHSGSRVRSSSGRPHYVV